MYFAEQRTIDIVSQPKCQKVEEGSRVEFQFKVQGEDTLSYQWLKDDVDLPGQTNESLVLDCIELRDFGSYTCQVSYQNGNEEPIESSPAVLDVFPAKSRNGMSEYCMQGLLLSKY